jgi:hypothetical protein
LLHDNAYSVALQYWSQVPEQVPQLVGSDDGFKLPVAAHRTYAREGTHALPLVAAGILHCRASEAPSVREAASVRGRPSVPIGASVAAGWSTDREASVGLGWFEVLLQASGKSSSRANQG